MITMIIAICVVINVAIICYTYYKISELKHYLTYSDTDNEILFNVILHLIDKFIKDLNNMPTNDNGYIYVDAINSFLTFLKVIINNREIEENAEN